MRLIDADAMLKRNENSIYDTTDLKEMLEHEPTAYDVDKVVEQLEELAKNNRQEGFDAERNGFSSVADRKYGKQYAFLKAIEIVKAGGIE